MKQDENRVKLTDQQAAALQTQGVSIALSAGAGCGKTFVLTQRFLSYLEPGPRQVPLNQIAAITFTERAAREMRDRIRSACAERLQNCPEADVDHWLKLLHTLDAARISTIHSFCSTILRTHAVDARIDPEFETLDQAETTALQRHLVKTQFRRMVSERDADAMLLVREYELENAEAHLCTLLNQRTSLQLNDFKDWTPNDLIACWKKHFDRNAIPAVIEKFTQSAVFRNVLNLLHNHESTHPKMITRAAVLKAELPSLSDINSIPELIQQLRHLKEHAKVQGGGSAKHWDHADVHENVKNAFSILRDHLGKLTSFINYDESHAEAAAELGLAALRVMSVLLNKYQLEKQARGVMDYDDLLLQTRDLLRDAPEVRRQLSHSISYLMVDEFQDTDPVQTEIVEMLCGDAIATGKLFFVGDAQQSIYRFRGADPTIFRRLREAIPTEGRLPLSVNFRSQPAILDFVNCLFGKTMGNGYEPLVPFHPSFDQSAPLIEFLFARDDTLDHASADDYRRVEADWIAQRILALLSDGISRVRDQNPDSKKEQLRPVEPGDIAILFRKKTSFKIYEEALRHAGLNYHLIGGRTFYNQQEVFDLVNLCQLLMNPDDEVSLLGVLRSPLFSLTDDTIATLVFDAGRLRDALDIPPPKSLPEQQRQQVLHAKDVLDELYHDKDTLQVSQLLNRAIERTGYDAALLLQTMGKRKLANLHKLIDLARKFDHGSQANLSEFVVRLRESVLDQTEEQEAATHAEKSDVVRMMTMHQSKGLEFPVVILADMNSEERNPEASVKLHAQLGPLVSLPKKANQERKNWGREILKAIEANEAEAEVLRLFYVATTRAKDLLILSGTKMEENPESPWAKLLSERFNLQTGLPTGDPLLGTQALAEVAPDKIPDIKIHHERPQADSQIDAAKSLSVPNMLKVLPQAQPAPLPPLLAAPECSQTGPITISVSQLEARVEATTPAGKFGSVETTSHILRGDEATELGSLVHQALDIMDFQQPQSVETLLEMCQRSRAEPLADSFKEQAIRMLEAFKQSELFTRLAATQKCYREIDFLLRWPVNTTMESAALISGQIDCLYQTANGNWHIVDYKTGRVTQKNDQELTATYELQLTVYALAVEQLFGASIPDAELCLIDDQVRLLPINMDRPSIQRVSQQIDDRLHSLTK